MLGFDLQLLFAVLLELFVVGGERVEQGALAGVELEGWVGVEVLRGGGFGLGGRVLFVAIDYVVGGTFIAIDNDKLLEVLHLHSVSHFLHLRCLETLLYRPINFIQILNLLLKRPRPKIPLSSYGSKLVVLASFFLSLKKFAAAYGLFAGTSNLSLLNSCPFDKFIFWSDFFGVSDDFSLMSATWCIPIKSVSSVGLVSCTSI